MIPEARLAAADARMWRSRDTPRRSNSVVYDSADEQTADAQPGSPTHLSVSEFGELTLQASSSASTMPVQDRDSAMGDAAVRPWRRAADWLLPGAPGAGHLRASCSHARHSPVPWHTSCSCRSSMQRKAGVWTIPSQLKQDTQSPTQHPGRGVHAPAVRRRAECLRRARRQACTPGPARRSRTTGTCCARTLPATSAGRQPWRSARTRPPTCRRGRMRCARSIAPC